MTYQEEKMQILNELWCKYGLPSSMDDFNKEASHAIDELVKAHVAENEKRLLDELKAMSETYTSKHDQPVQYFADDFIKAHKRGRP